jgi:hypothetical protein
MANPEHLEILKKGVEAWNEWRKEHAQILPDLSATDLSATDLSEANLAGANLSGAICNEANLSGAAFSGATLMVACCLAADFSDANLSDANLFGADLSDANLSNANLHGADLRWANLTRTELRNTNLREAKFGYTTIANTDLGAAKHLDTVKHGRPSSIGIDTLYKSQGKIPDEFLRNAGVPEEGIDFAHSIRNGPPTQWRPCFISYSHKDEDFAIRLHGRMRKAGMRVWHAPEHMKDGKKFHEPVFEAIQLEDRLLLVLSKNNMQSERVMTEIRKAREAEKKENRRKLFPIRLVDMETLQAWTCLDADTGKDLAVEVREYFIPDFSNWKDDKSFEAAFARLQKDLKTAKAKP